MQLAHERLLAGLSNLRPATEATPVRRKEYAVLVVSQLQEIVAAHQEDRSHSICWLQWRPNVKSRFNVTMQIHCAFASSAVVTQPLTGIAGV